MARKGVELPNTVKGELISESLTARREQVLLRAVNMANRLGQYCNDNGVPDFEANPLSGGTVAWKRTAVGRLRR
jgi:hypothetical protein